MTEIVFTWDTFKAAANFAKHHVAFDVAIKVFDDPLAVGVMDRIVEGEERWRTVGRVGLTTILFVGHTQVEDDGTIFVRVITARRATKQEVRAYEIGDEEHFR